VVAAGGFALCVLALSLWLVGPERSTRATPTGASERPAASEEVPGVPDRKLPATAERSPELPDSARLLVTDSFSTAAKALVVVDAAGVPITEAQAVLYADCRKLGADTQGRISFAEDPGIGTVGLVGAEGYRPLEFELVQQETTITLPEDPGFQVEVMWKDSGEPAAGALIRLRKAYRPPVVGEPPCKHEARDSLVDSEWPVDRNGRATLFGGEWVLGLVVTHPEGPTCLVDDITIGALERGGGWGWRPLTVLLDRVQSHWVFEFMDETARPLADRAVTIWTSRESHEAITNAQGRVELRVQFPESVYRFSDNQPRAEIELGGDRFWTAFPRRPVPVMQYRVAHRPLNGRVSTPILGTYSIASVSLHESFDLAQAVVPATRPGWFLPETESLVWKPVGASGSELLAEGWQGERSAVLLRHDPTGLVVDVAEVSEHGSFELQALPTCRLELHSATEATVPDFPIEVAPTGDVGFIIRPSVLPVTLEVPQGIYSVRWRLPPVAQTLGEIDAQVPERTVQLNLGPPRWISGSLRRRISGPVTDAYLSVRGGERDVASGLRTSTTGTFQFGVTYLDQLSFVPTMFDGDHLWPTEEKTFVLAAGAAEMHMVLPESQLVVHGGCSTTLQDAAVLSSTRLDADGKANQMLRASRSAVPSVQSCQPPAPRRVKHRRAAADGGRTHRLSALGRRKGSSRWRCRGDDRADDDSVRWPLLDDAPVRTLRDAANGGISLRSFHCLALDDFVPQHLFDILRRNHHLADPPDFSS
jgi:hypothetical protein